MCEKGSMLSLNHQKDMGILQNVKHNSFYTDKIKVALLGQLLLSLWF